MTIIYIFYSLTSSSISSSLLCPNICYRTFKSRI
nr:MAG TPA: hypothetical protein [Bacteriophage sp.]